MSINDKGVKRKCREQNSLSHIIDKQGYKRLEKLFTLDDGVTGAASSVSLEVVGEACKSKDTEMKIASFSKLKSLAQITKRHRNRWSYRSIS